MFSQKRASRPTETWKRVVRFDLVKLDINSMGCQSSSEKKGLLDKDKSDRPHLQEKLNSSMYK